MERDIVAELEEEGTELNIKYIKLSIFLESKSVRHIDPQQVSLMREQKQHMADYLAVLANRINLIKGKK